MPLVNVKKKVAKAGAKVGIEPGEEVLAGCTTNPSGTMKRMGAMTGSPKELLASWTHDEVVSITVDDGTLAYPFTVVFADGSAVQVEGAKGSDPRSVGEAYAAAKA